MRPRYAAIFASVLAFATPSAARAYVTTPRVAPANPDSTQLLSISVTAGFCDTFVGDAHSGSVSISGHRIRVVLYSRDNTDSFCIYPPASTFQFVVGPFTAGTYTLQIDRRYTPIAGPDVVETLSTTPLRVVSGRAAPVPATSPPILVLLAAGLSLLAAARMAGRNGTTPR